jgi:hypothetical protein
MIQMPSRRSCASRSGNIDSERRASSTDALLGAPNGADPYRALAARRLENAGVGGPNDAIPYHPLASRSVVRFHPATTGRMKIVGLLERFDERNQRRAEQDNRRLKAEASASDDDERLFAIGSYMTYVPSLVIAAFGFAAVAIAALRSPTDSS